MINGPCDLGYIFCDCFQRISYINLPRLMRWIFVRNAVNFAVNFCKKCGEMRWNIYFHRIHRNHRISYNNSPQSLPFLQKFTQKPRPGYDELWFQKFYTETRKIHHFKIFLSLNSKIFDFDYTWINILLRKPILLKCIYHGSNKNWPFFNSSPFDQIISDALMFFTFSFY